MAPFHFWRREWDSNPRWYRYHAGFQDRCLKPLGHLSVVLRFAGLSTKRRGGSCMARRVLEGRQPLMESAGRARARRAALSLQRPATATAGQRAGTAPRTSAACTVRRASGLRGSIACVAERAPGGAGAPAALRRRMFRRSIRVTCPQRFFLYRRISVRPRPARDCRAVRFCTGGRTRIF